jgi:3-oxoacyl-[acyl-carrier protein] reductase
VFVTIDNSTVYGSTRVHKIFREDRDMSGRFEGTVALVTGGAGGLGIAIAEAMGREGASVSLVDTNSEAIQRAVEHLTGQGISATGSVADVRNLDSVHEAVAATVAAIGPPTVLIAAAGGSVGTPRDIEDISPDDLDLVIDVNVKGTYYCSAAVIPQMKAAGGGSIVTFSSIGGRSTSPVTGVPYAAAKAGILGLTRRLAREVGPDGIRVNAIAPGLFLTGRLQGMFDEMSEHDRNEVLDSIPLRRMPLIEECVEPVLFLASHQSSYVTGAVLDVNGGRFMSG